MTYYSKTIADADRKLAARRARNKAFIIGEVLSFLLIIGTVVLFTNYDLGGWAAGIITFFILIYIGIRREDSKNDKAIRDLEDKRAVCAHETDYIDGKYSAFDDGKQYADARHPYALDLDIFGAGSLYQRICRAVTTGGADMIARALRLDDGFHDDRRNAIAELSRSPERLTEFKQLGQRGVADTSAVRKAFGKLVEIRLPRWARSRVLWVASCMYEVVFLCALVASIVWQTHILAMVWWCVFNFFAVYIICNRSMKEMTSVVGGLVRQLGVYVRLVDIVENVTTDEPVLAELRRKVDGAGESLRLLNDILQKLESRGNILGLFMFDMLFLWDYRILTGFYKWQQRYSSQFDGWIDAVGEYDMLVSMATFRYNERGLTTDAEVVGDRKVVYNAQGLFHPFLGRNAVRNDFTIDDRNFYIITGANMAGKSTFLRSLGVNYVLAMNGMPVFADKLVVSRFNLFTSMRTTDDLTHGISYFNAELLRLRQIIDAVNSNAVATGNGNRPTLIILDEILKGTNSEDKLSGSRMFLEYIAGKNVTGVIATHDLKLSAMADERPDRFHNYCFEIALGTDVTYSYKVTPGVARNQNATFLLKKMLGV